MKRKKIIKLISIICFLLFLVSIAIYFLFKNGDNVSSKEKKEAINSLSGELDLNNIDSYSEEYIKAKIDVLKKRIKLKDIISKGDNYFQNDKLTLAFIQYKIALNKNPNDTILIEKIGDVLFELKNYKNASLYYKKLLDLKSFDTDKYILSLIYSDFKNNDLTYTNTKNEINTNIKNEEQKFFYTNSLYCLENFHLCKKNFDDYFTNTNQNPTYSNLVDVKNAITNYNNFGLIDIYYKNTIMIGTFMKLKLYPLAITLGKNLLEEKPNYKAIIQVIAQSYFELGDYEEAKKYLKQYFELVPNDANAAYMLGIVSLEEGDYLPSNIFFTKALDLGYTDSINVRRKMAYNYNMLGDKMKMYETFDEMLDSEKDITKDDINIMINISTTNGDKDQTLLFAKKGLEHFSDVALFYGYIGKVELEKGDISGAKIYVERGLEIEPQNQLLNFVNGLIKVKENKIEEAKETLSNALELDEKSDIADEINQELTNLKNQNYNIN